MSISSATQSIPKNELVYLIEHALFEDKITIEFYEKIHNAISIFNEDESISYQVFLDKL